MMGEGNLEQQSRSLESQCPGYVSTSRGYIYHTEELQELQGKRVSTLVA